MESSPNEKGEKKGQQNDETLRDDSVLDKTNLRGDWTNIFLLLLLYTMQGLPLGITSAIPLILKSKKNSSYQDMAVFSLSDWPFSLKLLWAPLVDALSIQRLGRRKSWLVPVQYLIGAILIYTALDIDNLLPETEKINVAVLSCVFIVLNILAATQDIAVDGWSLTMLKKNNVCYAPVCNLVGHTIGMIVSVMPILLTSESFCNDYIRITPDVGGIVTLKCLLYVWGTMFLVVTSIIAIFKKENNNCTAISEYDHVHLNVVQTYVLVFKILKLPSVKILAIALFTSKIGFAAADSMTTLKVIDAGVSKDSILMISTAMFGVNAIMTIIFAKSTTGLQSMGVFLKIVLFRLVLNVSLALFIYFTPKLIIFNGSVNIPLYYYAILVFLKSIQNVLSYIMLLSSIAFFSRISDPRFGGTYMTLLNTISNLGASWSATVALGMVDWLTYNECSLDSSNNCSTQILKNTCKANKGECTVTVNGYYVEMALCTIAGIIWFVIFRNMIKNLHTKSPSCWLAITKNTNTENDKNTLSLSIM